jgi:excisionase family DNA binding protein
MQDNFIYQNPDPLFTTDKAAEYLGSNADTLATWRFRNAYGLPYVKIGERVLYKKSDLDRFIAERTVGGTSDA